MFIDEAVITIHAGNGGNGCYAHLREKYRPKGGPSGGNGGRGGHVYFVGSAQLRTLQDAAYRGHYRADRGEHGQGSNKYGKNGKDVVIAVPLGTLVYDAVTGDLLCDCLKENERIIVARGGAGGRGNAALATKSNPLPEYCEPGNAGEEKRLRLCLKLLADIGLVGKPNAGKSTLLSTISKARPRIADYPFTTTEPHLGIVTDDRYQTFVVADIPGLVEGAHQGKGMGIRFLRHIERTRMIAIMVESFSDTLREEAEMLIHELAEYSPLLAEKPKCFIATKIDACDTEHRLAVPDDWMQISAVTGDGIPDLLALFRRMIDTIDDDGAEPFVA